MNGLPGMCAYENIYVTFFSAFGTMKTKKVLNKSRKAETVYSPNKRNIEIITKVNVKLR